MDAFAAPFVQGRLRNQYLTVVVQTECAHCKTPMELTIDSDCNYTVKEKECHPVVFMPDIDLLNLNDENIIDAF